MGPRASVHNVSLLGNGYYFNFTGPRRKVCREVLESVLRVFLVCSQVLKGLTYECLYKMCKAAPWQWAPGFRTPVFRVSLKTLGKIRNPFIKEACEPGALQWSCAASGALQVKLTLRKPHIPLKYPYVLILRHSPYLRSPDCTQSKANPNSP